MAEELLAEDLDDLVRRDEIPADSFGLKGASYDGVGGSGSGGHSDPTGDLASGMADGEYRPRDNYRKNMRSLERFIGRGENFLIRAVQSVDFITATEEKARQRHSSTPCRVCQLQAAVKMGFCLDCHEEWTDAGQPDPIRWEMFKLGTTSSAGEVLVTSQPTRGS